MKKKYITPTTDIIETMIEHALAAGSEKNANYALGGGENGTANEKTGNISKTGGEATDDDFSQGAKAFSAWNTWED